MRTYGPVVSHLVTCAVLAAAAGALAWALADALAYGLAVAAFVLLLGAATVPRPRRRQPAATSRSASRSAGRPSASSTRARSSR